MHAIDDDGDPTEEDFLADPGFAIDLRAACLKHVDADHAEAVVWFSCG